LASRKEAFREWAKQKGVPFLDDPTNVGNYNDRAKIRAIMPSLLDVYPGIHQTLFGKLHAVLSE
jgi:tRNA(Ile)-lysidine synthase TilS/MesJ